MGCHVYCWTALFKHGSSSDNGSRTCTFQRSLQNRSGALIVVWRPDCVVRRPDCVVRRPNCGVTPWLWCDALIAMWLPDCVARRPDCVVRHPDCGVTPWLCGATPWLIIVVWRPNSDVTPRLRCYTLIVVRYPDMIVVRKQCHFKAQLLSLDTQR